MWGQLRGPRYWVQLDGSRHLSFTDFQVLLPQLGPYLLAFFDRHLRHRSARLLDGPSRRYPEIRFLPGPGADARPGAMGQT